MDKPTEPPIRRKAAAEYLRSAHGLQVAVATLAKYAVTGEGPPYYLAGRTPLYPIAELDAWAAARLGRLRRSTSDTGDARTARRLVSA